MLPIVLTHGYLGFGTIGPIDYFNNVVPVLNQMGASAVYPVDVPPKGNLVDRSTQLAAQIRKYVPAGKVHLIAHSMGGLDARYLIQQGNGRDLIATLTTLGSPFRGTVVADVADSPAKLIQIGPAKLLAAVVRFQIRTAVLLPVAAPAKFTFALNTFQDALTRLNGSDYSYAGQYFKQVFSLDDKALPELRTENCARQFPVDESDLQGIPTCSYAGSIEAAAVSPFLSASAILLDTAGTPHDGLVPVPSASLKDHRGNWPVDHLGLTGWGPTDVSNSFREIYSRLASQTY